MNGELLDRSLRHAVYLQRYKKTEVKSIIKLLGNDVLPDLLGKIDGRIQNNAGAWTTAKLQETAATLNEFMRGAMKGLGEKVDTRMSALAIAEAEWQKATLADVVPMNISFTLPSPELLRSIVTSRPFEGKVMGEWFETAGADVADQAMKQIKIGIATGESVDEMSKRLKGSLAERAGANVSATVRTATAFVTNEARQEVYKENDDVIKGEQAVATLDGRTTEFCMGIDGKVFPVGEGPRSPFHWGCRTIFVPITKSWKELGIPREETEPGERASMDGQVSETLTYEDWLKTQPEEFQNGVLGEERADVFRRGEISLDRFTDMNQKPLTLEQLIALEKKSFSDTPRKVSEYR